MGISRDKIHKRRKTGGRREPIHKKRKHEMGRPPANTKIGAKRIHDVRTRGGHTKRRAMRLDQGNFSWATQGIARKTRIIDVVYNSTNNELVRTKTLVKGIIAVIDGAPFRQFYEAHYLLPLGRREKTGKAKAATEAAAEAPSVLTQPRSASTMKKYEHRQKETKAKLDTQLEELFAAGRLLACISSRPGQVGRADGYILEGKELEFYLRKLRAKKTKF